MLVGTKHDILNGKNTASPVSGWIVESTTWLKFISVNEHEEDREKFGLPFFAFQSLSGSILSCWDVFANSCLHFSSSDEETNNVLASILISCVSALLDNNTYHSGFYFYFIFYLGSVTSIKCLILPQYVSWEYLGFAIRVCVFESVMVSSCFKDESLTQVNSACHGVISKQSNRERERKKEEGRPNHLSCRFI